MTLPRVEGHIEIPEIQDPDGFGIITDYMRGVKSEIKTATGVMGEMAVAQKTLNKAMEQILENIDRTVVKRLITRIAGSSSPR